LLEAAIAKVYSGRVMRVALNDDDLGAGTPAAELIGQISANGKQLLLNEPSLTIDLPLAGAHNARNLLLAIAVAKELSVEPSSTNIWFNSILTNLFFQFFRFIQVNLFQVLN
jgi:UDP-N-acetylmuramoyl-tripeptide--D-alanyl-D-alanine ligase